MGAELTSSTWFRRESIVLIDDSLVILEQESRQDRMRKVLFDQVSSLVVWRKFPFGRSFAFTAVLGVPATIVIVATLEGSIDRTDGYIPAGCMLGLLLLILLRYFVYGKTFVRIGYSGNVREFALIARPGRMRKFLDQLVVNIRKAQEEAIRRAEAQDAERQSDERSRLAAHAEGASEPGPAEQNPGASVQEA